MVSSVSLANFRSYARLELSLGPGLVLAVGPNGAGKTNLLESLHVGTQGFSPRTRSDGELIRFGSTAAQIRLEGARGRVPVRIGVSLSTVAGKRAELDGTRLRAAEQLRRETATLVFTPDRLAIVKAGPASRRAYFDRSLGRVLPARGSLPADYAAALAQRNAALKRGERDVIAPWTAQVASLGAALVESRVELLGLMERAFAEFAGRLGLPEARLAYEGEPPSEAALEAKLEHDLDRGSTGLGPHLHDVSVASATRDLRAFGSQGEQRTAVLALILAEARLITERRGEPPLLLLDDVLSELDPGRRRVLVQEIQDRGQTVVTATTADALPGEPAQLLEVSPGRVVLG
ncbi:MAG: DNA replication/repair protein RecF [Verrucomicrobiota bacterium]